MAFAPDSESAFKELGRHSAMSNFALNGWKTCGSLAFAVPGGPGRDEDLFQATVVKVLVDDAQKHLASSLSRLHFKSYTIEIADLRRRTERSSRDQPRKLPNSEKAGADRQGRDETPWSEDCGQMLPGHVSY